MEKLEEDSFGLYFCSVRGIKFCFVKSIYREFFFWILGREGVEV